MFPIVMALLATLGLLARSRTMERARAEENLAEELVRRISEVYSSLQTSLIRRDAEARREWDNHTRLLEGFLAERIAKELASKSELSLLLGESRAIRTNAARLLDLRNAPLQESAEPGELPKLEKAVAADMGSLLMAALRFVRTTGAEGRDAERMADKFLMVFVAVAGLVLAGLTIAASRDVVRRMRKLKEAAGKVAAGDFNALIESIMGDELSEAFLAFNEMVVRLEQAFNTVKHERDDWKREYDKGFDAAAKARQANMSLADALTKLKRAQQQIVQQERLRALEQIVKGVARDFAVRLRPWSARSISSWPIRSASATAGSLPSICCVSMARRARRSGRSACSPRFS
ncbi:MAG: methyl-accepting chemotaxis protein [Verrucomicrobiota bacterium]|nr:methyl-accepting chemotaxis protein [Verrucomicrobiota bacterium]